MVRRLWPLAAAGAALIGALAACPPGVADEAPANPNHTWTTKTPMPTARYAPAAVVNGIIYAIGGDNGGLGSSIFNTVEAFTP